MNERDRLIELLLETEIHTDTKELEEYAMRRAEYKANHLLRNGVIVPPCKVGDKLYAISENRIAECICVEISIHNEVTICAEFQCDYDCKGCPFNAWKQDFYTGEYSCDGEYGTCFFSFKRFWQNSIPHKRRSRTDIEKNERLLIIERQKVDKLWE